MGVCATSLLVRPLLTYKVMQSGSPSYLSSVIRDYAPYRSLTSSVRLLLSHFYMSLIMADRAFSVSASQIWNEPSFNFHAATCISSFIRNLNCELFAIAYVDHFHQPIPLLPPILVFLAWINWCITNWFLPARCYASAGISCHHVCVYVCSSHASILSKWLHGSG